MVFPAHRRQIGFVCTTSPPIAAAGLRGRIGLVSHNRCDHWLRLCAGRGSGTRGRLLVGWASPPDFFCPPADRQIGFVSHGRSTGASHFKHQPSHFRLLLFICLPLLPAVLHETCRKNGLRHPPKSPQVLVLTPVKKNLGTGPFSVLDCCTNGNVIGVSRGQGLPPNSDHTRKNRRNTGGRVTDRTLAALYSKKSGWM